MARKHRIDIRVTEDEKQQIINNSFGNVSDWLRDFGLGNKRKKVKLIQQDPALIEQTRSIGVCLNQLTRNMNTKLKAGGFDDIALVEYNIHLAQINESLSALVTKDDGNKL